jgi:hypothetical protein
MLIDQRLCKRSFYDLRNKADSSQFSKQSLHCHCIGKYKSWPLPITHPVSLFPLAHSLVRSLSHFLPSSHTSLHPKTSSLKEGEDEEKVYFHSLYKSADISFKVSDDNSAYQNPLPSLNLSGRRSNLSRALSP